jgi:NAD(P)-dependent dehydrogenase (short-subunit alcohol dehydrogenase family)
MSKVWLITGSGNGLGRDIAKAALAAGDCVVAGARRTEELAPLVAQYGEWVRPVRLEVRDEAAAKAAVQLAVDSFGRLDVLVNNAGYGQFAPFEQMTAEDFQAVVDTCLYGVVYTTRAAVPVMRKQKRGHIFQVSSVGGRLGFPGNTPYHAAKWAVGGFSDSLAMEVAPFGVKVCTLEPGGIRTNWQRRAAQNAPALLPDYEVSVGSMLKMLRGLEGHAEGDPRKIAGVIVQLVNSDEVPMRLILGVDAEQRVQRPEAARAMEAEKWRHLTVSTVFEDERFGARERRSGRKLTCANAAGPGTSRSRSPRTRFWPTSGLPSTRPEFVPANPQPPGDDQRRMADKARNAQLW